MRRSMSMGLAVLCLVICLAVTACGSPAAMRPPPAVPSAYLFHNVRVLYPDRAEAGPTTTVLVVDGVIAGVGVPDTGTLPEGTQEIDGAGRVLMPGLIDMHVHIFDEAGLAANLVHGVTTVRNLGGMPFHPGLARRIEAGRIAGPRLVSTGPIINERGGRNANPLQVLVDGADEARAEVRRQHRRGYRHLKVYSNLSRESFAAVLDEAAALGMSVSGHPVEGRPADPMEIGHTLLAGLATIEHAESIVWHGLDDNPDPAGMTRLAAEFAAAGATVSPTLVVHENLSRIVETRGAHLQRADMTGFNPVVAGFERDTYEFWTAYRNEDRTRMQGVYEEFTGALHAAGVRLVVGTDAGIMATPHGVSVLREMELLVRAGLTPHEALRAATVNAADVLGLADRLGRVEPGYRADLVLADADPRVDFQILRRPAGVMRDGVWYDAVALAELREAARQPGAWRTRRRLLMHFLLK
ncbi:amidohydrolase family protein [Maricaulis sp.]|uniref:amidohydrolase family protein n=1 Tax=Maricaulis sp. TaxID=1486257 RepID=UPI00260C3A47|nr:amidohydrolase family protein [Maricaulis sp.]